MVTTIINLTMMYGTGIIVDAFANSFIDSMKPVVCSTLTDILPVFEAESEDTTFKLGCW